MSLKLGVFYGLPDLVDIFVADCMTLSLFLAFLPLSSLRQLDMPSL
jgi:hypothetical protein